MENTQSIIVIDSVLETPLPFAVISFDSSSITTNYKGYFLAPLNINKLAIEAPDYEKKVIQFPFPDTIRLTKNHSLIEVFHTDFNSAQAIKNVLKHKPQNNPFSNAPLKYTSYNKFYVYTNQTHKTKRFLNKLLDPFSVKLDDFSNNHYLILSESTTERSYKRELKEEEIVTASKLSGIDRPMLLSLNSQVQTFSYYDTYIRIASKEYVGPLAHGTLNRYHFSIIDTLRTNNDTTLVVQFNPRTEKRFESLKGYLYINKGDYALIGIVFEPARESKTSIQVIQTSNNDNGYWFPSATLTRITLDNIGSDNARFTAIAESQITQVITPYNLSRKHFSDIAVFFDTEKASTDSLLRPAPLKPIEQNTYDYYDTVGTINNFTRAINLGEQLYYKKIPYKYYNLDLDHLVDLNDLTGPQIGLGASTNNTFSSLISFNGYTEYGFNDKESKFGIGTILTSPWKRKLQLHLNLSKDLEEAGGRPLFFQHKSMYNTEWLRKIRRKQFDKVKSFDIHLSTNPFNYIFLEPGIRISQSTPTYSYQFTDDSLDVSDYKEVYLSMKFAYGERFFKLLNERISLGRPFPILWLKYSQGILNNEINYIQLYSRVEYRHKIPGYGSLGIQLSAGKTWGDLPYGKLYNGRGSYGVRTVAHNSFETMKYNEFLSSEFITLFLAHDFGFSNYLEYKNFRPRVELALNVGIGRLTNFNDHRGVDFKTMEKGFVETGIMVNNFLIINITPLKAGLGLGYFYRIGAYQLPTFSENSVFKLSTTFNL